MIAEQCRAGRTLLNMTVKELAARARVATDTIVRFENSVGMPLKPRAVDAIKAALEALESSSRKAAAWGRVHDRAARRAGMRSVTD